jgi:hypothetical protein
MNRKVCSIKGVVMYHTTYDHQQNGTSTTIRAAGPADAAALRRLAQRDTQALPEGDLLVAIVDGEARAAISLASGKSIADPFHPTAELVRMLELHGSRLDPEPRLGGPEGPPLRGTAAPRTSTAGC